MVGGRYMVKADALVAVPLGVVTLMVPLVAPGGTTAVIEVLLTIVKLLAARPLNMTAVAPVNEVPVSVTVVPTPPAAGVKLVMVGAATIVKLVELVAVPPGVVTLIVPVVAPVGTTAVMDAVLTTVKLLAAVPLNLTVVAPAKAVPVKVMVVPTPPVVGVKLVMAGAATKAKLDALVAVPPTVVTLRVPLVAPMGTTAVIEVSLTTV